VLVQAWKSDELKDDWELERSVDARQGGSRTVRLRGAGGTVDSVFTSGFLGDLMQPQPPCSAAECCELNDDSALEVCSPLLRQRMVIIVHVVDSSMSQATRDACSPVQLLQLLQPDLYTEDDAAALAVQARARVLIFVKTVSKAKAATKYRDEQARAAMQRNMVLGGALGAALVCIFVAWKRRQ
jgi:hypothetical protein